MKKMVDGLGKMLKYGIFFTLEEQFSYTVNHFFFGKVQLLVDGFISPTVYQKLGPYQKNGRRFRENAKVRYFFYPRGAVFLYRQPFFLVYHYFFCRWFHTVNRQPKVIALTKKMVDGLEKMLKYGIFSTLE
jgi:hypothetical protein